MLLDLAVGTTGEIDDEFGCIVARNDAARGVVHERNAGQGPEICALALRRLVPGGPVADTQGVVGAAKAAPSPMALDLARQVGPDGRGPRQQRRACFRSPRPWKFYDSDVGRLDLEGPGDAVPVHARMFLVQTIDDDVVAPSGDAAVRLGRAVDLEAVRVGPTTTSASANPFGRCPGRTRNKLVDVGLAVAHLRVLASRAFSQSTTEGSDLYSTSTIRARAFLPSFLFTAATAHLLAGVAEAGGGEVLQGALGCRVRPAPAARLIAGEDLGRGVRRAQDLADEHAPEPDVGVDLARPVRISRPSTRGVILPMCRKSSLPFMSGPLRAFSPRAPTAS